MKLSKKLASSKPLYKKMAVILFAIVLYYFARPLLIDIFSDLLSDVIFVLIVLRLLKIKINLKKIFSFVNLLLRFILKKIIRMNPIMLISRALLFIILIFVGFYLGVKYQEKAHITDNPNAIQDIKEVYPECIADICPRFYQIDATYSNRSPETAIVIPLAMTQGYGRLVIVEEGGRKLFDSGGLPGIGVESVDDGNGFILQYSSEYDEDFNRKNYEVRYVWKDGKFVEKEKKEIMPESKK